MDTSPAAAAIQLQIHRRLSGAERLQIAFDMSAMARELALTRLRLENPAASERELQTILLRMLHGRDVVPDPR